MQLALLWSADQPLNLEIGTWFGLHKYPKLDMLAHRPDRGEDSGWSVVVHGEEVGCAAGCSKQFALPLDDARSSTIKDTFETSSIFSKSGDNMPPRQCDVICMPAEPYYRFKLDRSLWGTAPWMVRRNPQPESSCNALL